MNKYDDFHSSDVELLGLIDNKKYCTQLTPEEEETIPYLSFPLLKTCNFACVYCGEAGEATASNLDEISLTKIKELVGAATKLGVKKFRITGGEPFLHNDIASILRYLDGVGCYSHVNTNGSLVIEHKDLIEQLNNSSLNFVISLDTLKPERFLKIARPRDARFTLENTLAGIELLSSLGLLCRINMVVTSLNIDEVFDMIKFCSDHKCLLKLLDLVSVPVPFGKRLDYYVDLTELETALREKCEGVVSHSYSKRYGVPCVRYKYGNTLVTLKNGIKGTHFDKEGICKGCTYYPCHEGLYDMFAYPDGKICPCRWNDTQHSDDPEKQLAYIIEGFHRANFTDEVNSVHSDMPTRWELLRE